MGARTRKNTPTTMTRRIRVMFALVALAATPLFASLGRADRAQTPAGFHRGIGISHAMAWARINPGPARAFSFPPFSEPGNALTLEELRTLRRTGFDFVRLAVDPGPFLQFQGARRDELDRILIDRVKLVLDSGLSVIVAFFPSDLHPDYTARALTVGLDAPIFQAYLRLLERTAALLDALHSSKVALELMNEPPVQPGVWQPMLKAAYVAARRRSANLRLVLEGGEEASAAALMAIRTDPFAKDRAVLFTFHYYDPYQFTHQGASWNDARYLADVPYPARIRPLQDSLDATAAAIAASDLSQPQKATAYRDAQARLESYRRSGFDDKAIAKSFDQVAAWARARGLPPDQVMLGEFGARKTAFQLSGAAAGERARWFHDVSEAAESRGFGWAVWTYRGAGGFALTRGETDSDIEPAVAQALGLGLRPQRRADGAR